MPLPHIPPPHMPAPQSLGAALAAPLDPAEWAANVEYCVVRCFRPQLGHSNASASALRRTSFSKVVPQSSQEYSKIGIQPNYKALGRPRLHPKPGYNHL
jgi:hypothetical protein